MKRKPNPPKELLNFISSNELIDVSRLMYPKSKDYTYYFHSQNSYSRLDYIFISKIGIGDVIASKVQDIIISDHAAVTCAHQKTRCYIEYGE